jgi:hypothetical protein
MSCITLDGSWRSLVIIVSDYRLGDLGSIPGGGKVF